MRGIKGLKLAGIWLLVAFFACVAVWYVSDTSERERYLTSRNFRLLATIATQLDNSISGQQRTFATLLTADPSTDTGWFTSARDFIPSLQALDEERIPKSLQPVDSALVLKEPEKELKKSQAVIDDRGTWLQLSITKDAESRLSSTSNTRNVWLTLDGLLAPIFAPKLRDGAFDALVLASTDGRVLHAEGRQSSGLMLARLDQLESPARSFALLGNAQAQPKPPGFASIARSSGVIEVQISGTTYKLFTQPCCLATSAPASGRAQEATGLVVVGLVDANAFRSKARQISPNVVMFWIAVILFGAASWPFLKLWLIGERQRVRRLDVMEVIGCGMFSIALLTMVCLDLYAYQQLRQTRDAQLSSLAEKLAQNVRLELNAALDQLEALTSVIPCAPPLATAPLKSVETQILKDDREWTCKGLPIPRPYPQFKTMAMINAEGRQQVKWSASVWQPAPIKVATREYFTAVKAGRFWQLPPADDKPHAPGQSASRDYRLESIWSWTTTEPEAVLSMPTGWTELPVAALTIPMMSVVDPVIAAGFEFAIIKDDGDVVFHSDPQRNTYENLFEETDQDRRLRAAVAAHIHEHLNLLYAGRSYRGYVMRLGAGTPWSVVTLSSNEAEWALHIEWLVLALAALGVHMLVWAALFGLCLFAGHADWLWADPTQARRYFWLSVVVTALLAIGGVVLTVGSNTSVIVASFVLPLAAWAIGYLAIRRRPRDGKPLRESYGEYASLMVLLFLLTSMIPAAGFFTVAYRMQVRTDVKYTQLQLARDIPRRAERLKRVYEERPGAVSPIANDPTVPVYDLYHAFPHSTTLELATDAQSQAPPASFLDPGPIQDSGGLIQSFLEEFQNVLEEYLPYYSERSVQMRELLLHERATDHAWWWLDDVQPSLVFKGAAAAPSLLVNSRAPALAQGILGATSVEPGIWIVLAGLLLAALTWAVVRFIETHVCLRGVEQPPWSNAGPTRNRGDNLFVVCDASGRQVLAADAFELNLELLWDHELMADLIDLDRKDPERPVLLPDFDKHLDDPKLTRRKLDWIERLAADQNSSLIVQSSSSPSLVEQALRVKSRGLAIGTQLIERWRSVRPLFVIINRPAAAGEKTAETAPFWRGVWTALHPAHGAWHAATLRDLPLLWRDWSARKTLRNEEAGDAFVSAVCESIRCRPEASPSEADGRSGASATGSTTKSTLRLSSDQILDEVAERTDAWYRRLWRSCTADEQLVLAEIASEGFVNHKSRRTVRRLLRRGLIAKDPSFRLMNKTFRRFVLSPACQHDIHAIEGASDPSSWDRFHAPFFAVLIGAALYFLVTQREMFNATIATLTTVGAALPVLTRMLALVAGKRAELETPKV